jgi:hypothetical protein
MAKPAGSDDSFARLHAAGWTVGHVAVHSTSGLVWIVSGTNGENRVEGRGGTQNEAWHNAVLQAEAMGMAGLSRSTPSMNWLTLPGTLPATSGAILRLCFR